MRSGGGRIKGSSFERKVAKLILRAAHHSGIHVSKKDCYRTPMSGGHVYAKQSHPSDLRISSRLRKHFRFIVECKFYKKVSLWHFILQAPPSAKELSWLKQLRRESKRVKSRTPLLVFKGNNLPVMCCLPVVPQVSVNLIPIEYYIVFNFKHTRWVLIPFDAFLKQIFKRKNNHGHK